MQETSGLGRSPGEGIGYPVFLGFPGGSDGKESACNAGDMGSIPGLGRSPGGGHDNELPLPASILVWRTPMNREAWQATVPGVTKSWTRLSDLAQHTEQTMYNGMQ